MTPATAATTAPSAPLADLFPHQAAAHAAVAARIEAGARRSLVLLPCGTGKTRIGAAIAASHAPRRVLVLLPSLALVEQTLAEWTRLPDLDVDPVLVCSDASTADGLAERDGRASGQPRLVWHQSAVPVTTSADRVARLLSRGARHGTQLVLCTYHSLPTLAAAVAYAAADVVFDLLIADEAHRLAGTPSAAFRLAFDDAALPATHRVFLTATPVTEDTRVRPGDAFCSMDDPELFGEVAYQMSFGEAIADGLLSDYRVVVCAADAASAADLGVPDDEVSPQELAALSVLRTAAADHGLSRVLSFHGRVRAAERFAGLVTQAGEFPDGRRPWVRTVAADTPVLGRRQVLAEMTARGADEVAVVTSARCLSEGIDLPAVDAALFCSPKTSPVDIVQSVGRVLRRAEGKTAGTIVVPVAIAADEGDEDSELLSSTYGHVWAVLRALRAVDERLADELDSSARTLSRRGVLDSSRTVDRVTWLLPPGYRDEFVARTVHVVGNAWERAFGLLEAFVDVHGTAAVPRDHVCGAPRPGRPDATFGLGAWVVRQQIARRRGLLPADRAARLAALPGWVWQRGPHADAPLLLAKIDRVPRIDDGTLDYATLAQTRLRGRRTLGEFAARMRTDYRLGLLTAAQVTACEQVAGWDWSAVEPADREMVDLLADYAAWEGHADPPADYREGDLELGGWLEGLRRRRVLGTAPAQLIDEVTAVTPPAHAPGRVQWRGTETLWLIGYEALCAFAAREGHLRVPHGHVETVDGYPVALSAWMRARRNEHRHGKHTAARVALLEAVPGWRWEITPAARRRADIGTTAHGTRAGYVKRCRCRPCTDANVAYNRTREQRLRNGEPGTDWVAATAATAHLRRLRDQGATSRAMVRASSLGRSHIRELLEGTVARIRPQTEATVLALTLEQVRGATAAGTLVDAGPTWVLLEDLIGRGWPKWWLARELGAGGKRPALQIRRDQVTAQTAGKVAGLAARVGDLCPPTLPPGTSLPALADLQAAQGPAAQGAGGEAAAASSWWLAW